MYDYTAMVNTIDGGTYQDGIGPLRYFLWRNNDFQQCWDYLDGSASLCYPNDGERQTVAQNYDIIGDCPTMAPTANPTDQPTPMPTPIPTPMPTPGPTTDPTMFPTWSQAPTESPTPGPTTAPTSGPTSAPTSSPTTD